MSIEVSHITKLYGRQRAVNDVTFSIPSGEVVGLLGPNGAGKSTLMRIITCFIPPTSGDVEVCGFNIYQQPIEVRRRIGYLPENNPLYPEMYVREYLEFVGGLYHIPGNIRDRVEQIIRQTGLTVEQRKKIGALSKGFRQRVGLAQALIHDPDVLILDEPTSGLDPNQLVEIRNLIREIGKEKTVMLSTHIMQEVEAVCDRAVIIDKGVIVADGAPGSLSEISRKHRIVRVEFNEAVNMDKLRSLKNIISVSLIKDCLYEVATEGDDDIRPDLFRFAVEEGLTVLSMNRSEATLEEVFRNLTHQDNT
ncbi:MAG: gliding motility-associated ABC transporter ATP-binding subunit GldA [Bacteroidales bacterium]|nr:gliding motility-associated ABC transporter ATP-binding subunit GldA [Bacteroidales bacterium]